MMMKEIDVELPIKVFIDGDDLLLSQKRHASLILGNTSVSGNEHIFKISKRPDGYVVIPLSIVKRERDKFIQRIAVATEKLSVVQAILWQVEK